MMLRRGMFVWLPLALVGAAGASVQASDPAGVRARPVAVVFESDSPDAVVRVRVAGRVAMANDLGGYAPSVCGYLYYRCKPGSDVTLCREQWNDLATAAGAGTCAWFGVRRDYATAGLYNNGRIRPGTETPSGPDDYDPAVGLGVVTTACEPDLAGACEAAWGPGGGTGGQGGSVVSSGGGKNGSETGGQNGETSGGGAAGEVPAATDLPAGKARKSNGCALAGDAEPLSLASATIALLLLAGIRLREKAHARR